MFKNIYNRCKNYLNSYATIGTVVLLLFFLILPTITYKIEHGFFYEIIFAYQYGLINTLTILLYVYNFWNYLHKNISITYQAHRYGDTKKVIKNNICDLIFIGLVLQVVFLILNISFAVLLNDGYYMSVYKYYNMANLYYLMYNFIIRIIFISIISVIVYFIYYTKNKIIKFILTIIVTINLIDLSAYLPITMNSILSGYEFSSFGMEVIVTLIMISIYIVSLILIKKNITNKKRDIG